MKIVVMSDTHLWTVTQEFERICRVNCEEADLVVHLGDWVDGTVADFMEQYPLEAVAGNMDGFAIRDRYPAKKVIRLQGFRIGLTHGWGSAGDLRARLAREFHDVDAVLFGHTHQPLQEQEKGVLWFNPGSVFHGRGEISRSLGILYAGRSLQTEIIRV